MAVADNRQGESESSPPEGASELPADTTQPSETHAGPDARFKNAGEGTDAVQKGFNNWTSLLSNRSLNASYAVIGAAWAVFGTADNLMGNGLALLAVGLAVGFIGVSVLFTFLAALLHWLRLRHALSDPKRWQAEYQNSASVDSNWPYTKGIDRLPIPYNIVKILIPGAAVICLVIAIVNSYGQPVGEPKPATSILWFP